MKLIKQLYNLYIFGNVHVALAGFCLTKITEHRLDLESTILPWFIGLSILVSYNFIRFVDRSKKQDVWVHEWLKKSRIILCVLTGFAGLGMLYIVLFISFNFNTFMLLIPLAFMTFFYAIPLGSYKGELVSFRRFPGIKIFSIGIAWAGVTVLLPVIEAGMPLDLPVTLEFIQRICFLIAITIPFDIRDMNWDNTALKTLPQVLGLQPVKYVGFALVLVFFVLDFYRYNSLETVLVTLAISVLIVLFLIRSKPKQGIYFTNFWVEMVPIIWFVLINVFLMR